MALIIHLGSVALLALVVEVVCRIGRFRPALCHALWLVVFLKLLVPPFVAWPLYLDTLQQFATQPTAPSMGHESIPGQGTAHVSVGLPRPPGDAAVDAPRVALPAIADSGHSATTFFTHTIIISGIFLWASGTLCLIGFGLWQAIRIRRQRAQGKDLPEWLHAQLETVAGAMKMVPPRGRVLPHAKGVYIHAAGKPELIVSEAALEEIDPARWNTILTHELAHLKRRDHWVLWILFLGQCIWWWNPLLWWIQQRVRLYSELACDTWVVSLHPEERRNYADNIVRIMGLLSKHPTTAPQFSLAAWQVGNEERRLWMIMKATQGHRVSRPLGIAIVALACAVTPAWVALGNPEDVVPVTEKVAQKPPVQTPSETNTPAESLPQVIPIPLEKKPKDPVEAGWILMPQTDENFLALLATPVRIEFEDIHLKDIMEFLQDSYEVNVILDQRAVAPESADSSESYVMPDSGAPHAYVTDGHVTYINLDDVPFRDALAALGRPRNLEPMVWGNTIWLTSAELAQDSRPMPRAAFTEGEILDRLKSAVNIEFEQIHLSDIVEFITDSFEINIVLDDRVIMPEGGNWNSPPLGSDGFHSDGMIQYINLEDTPLGEALYVLTRLLDLSYSVEKDYIFISTAEKLN